MDSGHIAQGLVTREFEERIAQYVGTKYAVAVSSGTTGLFLVYKALGITEAVTTPFSFIATVTAMYMANVKPHFADINRMTYNIDHAKASRFNMPCVPVDVFGNPASTDYETVILDSCESLGTKVHRKFDACVYAFYPNKVLTSGEGGVICTDRKDIADYCIMARNQGRSPSDEWLNSSICGWNFRMSDIHAAIGVEQMKRIDEIIQKRIEARACYFKCLWDKGIPYKTQEISDCEQYSPFVFTLEFTDRDMVIQHLTENRIETKPYFPCIHLQPWMKGEGMYPVAEEVSKLTLALPFFTDITKKEIETVVERVGEISEDRKN
jgi:perosamine synthetase